MHRRQSQGGDLARLKIALDAARETETSGWRPVEVHTVVQSEEAFSEGVGRVGEIEAVSAIRALESTLEEVKRVSRSCCPFYLRHSHRSMISIESFTSSVAICSGGSTRSARTLSSGSRSVSRAT